MPDSQTGTPQVQETVESGMVRAAGALKGILQDRELAEALAVWQRNLYECLRQHGFMAQEALELLKNSPFTFGLGKP